MVEANFSAKIGTLRSNRGGKYLYNAFDSFCTKKGIHHQLIVSHTPHQNGVAEQKTHSLMEMARNIYIGSNFPAYLWKEPICVMAYVLNCITTKALV